MASAISTLKEIFLASISIDLIILMLILYAAVFIASIPAFVIGFLVAFFAVIAMSSSQAPIIALIVIFGLVFLLFFVFFIALGSLQTGILVKGAKNVFENKKAKAMELFNEVKPRWKTLLVLQLALTFFYLLLLFVVFIPSLLAVLDAAANPPFSLLELAQFAPAVEQENYEPIISFFVEKFFGLILLITGTFLFYELVLFLVSPFTVLMVPLVVFENKSVFEAVRRGIFLGKKNYFFNLKVLFVYFFVSLVFCALVFGLLFLVSDASALSTVFSLYSALFFSAMSAKLYMANTAVKN